MSISGYDVIHEYIESTSEVLDLVAEVPEGKVAIGGGATCFDSRARMFTNGPVFNGPNLVAWRGSVVNSEFPSQAGLVLHVYCIVADA